VLLANSFKDKYSRYNSLMYFYEQEKSVNTQTVGIFIFMDYFNKCVEERYLYRSDCSAHKVLHECDCSDCSS